MTYKLLEILKSSETRNKWDEVTNLLIHAKKDSSERINHISQSILYLNTYSEQQNKEIVKDKDKFVNFVKLICKQEKLSCNEVSKNGSNCLELSCDCFRIIIVLNDIRLSTYDPKLGIVKQVLFEYNKEKPVNCVELQKSLCDGDFNQLNIHIDELFRLYSVGNDRTQQLKAFLCLQALEEDINKLVQCPLIVNSVCANQIIDFPQPSNLIGLVKCRSGGISSQFIYYRPPNGSMKSMEFDESSDKYAVKVQIISHCDNNLLPFIPLVNLQKDSNGNCVPSYVNVDSLMRVSLNAKFVLRLQRPIVMPMKIAASFSVITGLSVISTGKQGNYVDLLLEQNGSSLTSDDQMYSILPDESQVVFEISNDENNDSMSAVIVTYIPFLLPNHLPKIIAILKKQAVINSLMESFLIGSGCGTSENFDHDVTGAQSIQVTILSHDTFIFSLTVATTNFINFTVSFNEFGLSSIKVNSLSSLTPHLQLLQKIMRKYNDIVILIFWILYKCGDICVDYESCIMEDTVDGGSKTPTIYDESEESSKVKLEYYQYVDECVKRAISNVSINCTYDEESYPKIKIEPKLELIMTSSQQIVTTPPNMIFNDSIPPMMSKPVVTTTVASVFEAPHSQDIPRQMPFQNSNCYSGFNQTPTASGVATSNLPASYSSQTFNSHDQSTPYSNYGMKHMSLDQMLSSDFAMPFSTESSMAVLNIPGSNHNPIEYSSHSATPITTTSAFSVAHSTSHSFYKDSVSSKQAKIPNEETGQIKKIKKKTRVANSAQEQARAFDSQSSVLVNLLNSSENTVSNSCSTLFSRHMIGTSNYPHHQTPQMFDIPDSQRILPPMQRGMNTPRIRMPSSSQPRPASLPVTNNNVLSMSPSPCPKAEMMLMPYPQDTGSGKAPSSRKPRKRKTPTLELNQRLPKQPILQPPMIRQSSHESSFHNQNIPVNIHHGQPPNIHMHQPPNSQSICNFSSPTTTDQSVYDFDDNTDCSKSRAVYSSSSLASTSNAINSSTVNRRINPGASKKSLKVKISRKIINQNNSSVNSNDNNTSSKMDSMNCIDHEVKFREKEKLFRSNTTPNLNSNVSRSTAIMSAIDSPLTCSSLSSMQPSPHAMVHSFPGSIENVTDTSLIKKKRKRRIKIDGLDETTVDGGSISNKKASVEKLEVRKRKRKDGVASVLNVQTGVGSNSSVETSSSVSMESGIKAPLPIRLSVNAKMGSVNTSSSVNMMNSNANNPSLPPMRNSSKTGNTSTNINNSSSSSLSSVNVSSGSSFGTHNNMLKHALKEAKITSNVNSSEPILKNYKIPKKKANDNNNSNNHHQDLGGICSQDQSLQFPQIKQQQQKSVPKDFLDNSKTMDNSSCSSSVSDANSFVKRSKSPSVLHSDSSMQAVGNNLTGSDCDPTKTVGHDLQIGGVTSSKVHKIHDVIDRIRAKSSNTSSNNSSTNNETTAMMMNSNSSNAGIQIPPDISGTDRCLMSATDSVNNNGMNQAENIFEKFGRGAANKSDYRPYPVMRQCDQVMGYPYNRPPPGFAAQKPRPPFNNSFPYQPRQQPQSFNPYRMDVRNFSPNPTNTQFAQRKNTPAIRNPNSNSNKKK